MVLPVGVLGSLSLNLACFTLVLLAESFFVSALAFHLSDELVAFVDLVHEVVGEDIKDLVLAVSRGESLLDLSLTINLFLEFL